MGAGLRQVPRSLGKAVILLIARYILTCGTCFARLPLRGLCSPVLLLLAQSGRRGFEAADRPRPNLLSHRHPDTYCGGALGSSFVEGLPRAPNLSGSKLGTGLTEPSCFDLERIRAVGLFWVGFLGAWLGCLSSCM